MAQSKANNTVRISAGEWRSRLLKFPDVDGLRPTPDRVRQTVFNWLGQELHGLTCLDLFAGTGVMGFEALSRGAKQAVLVENSRPAYQALLDNKTSLKAEHATILNQDALHFLKQNKALFDVVFIDPPFAMGMAVQACQWLEDKDWLSKHAKIYVEAESTLKLDGIPPNWRQLKSKVAGEVGYHLFERQG